MSQTPFRTPAITDGQMREVDRIAVAYMAPFEDDSIVPLTEA